MKLAVSSTGPDLSSDVDPRFGRASYILVVDTDTLAVEVIDNAANKDAFKGAGIQAAAAVCDKGADILLTGFCGPNAFKTLDAAGVKVANDVSGTVQSAVERFKAGEFTFSSTPNTEGHW
ncbi:MAG: NifB/NifX family molybdenum-iron cluster-binding protein [Desulfotignum sp.]|nr:NifB/NifX family molybdenum-iron cluster-binding protein [Desulfotignum sp.]MCF8112751.1 NifB/NifX family molybdenum-iron cluster-binding protein [Desulfotignum sp.]